MKVNNIGFSKNDPGVLFTLASWNSEKISLQVKENTKYEHINLRLITKNSLTKYFWIFSYKATVKIICITL